MAVVSFTRPAVRRTALERRLDLAKAGPGLHPRLHRAPAKVLLSIAADALEHADEPQLAAVVRELPSSQFLQTMRELDHNSPIFAQVLQKMALSHLLGVMPSELPPMAELPRRKRLTYGSPLQRKMAAVEACRPEAAEFVGQLLDDILKQEQEADA
jgi:hypothetical protein